MFIPSVNHNVNSTIINETLLTYCVAFFLSWQAAGAALAYVGAYVIRSYDNFNSFIQDKYTLIPAAIIIGVSVVMFIFGLVGCCATLRESKVGLSFVSEKCVCVCVCVCVFQREKESESSIEKRNVLLHGQLLSL